MARRRQRLSKIRKRAVAGSVGAFMTAWAAIGFQLVSGHDPALSKSSPVALVSKKSKSASANSTSTDSTSTGSAHGLGLDRIDDDGVVPSRRSRRGSREGSRQAAFQSQIQLTDPRLRDYVGSRGDSFAPAGGSGRLPRRAPRGFDCYQKALGCGRYRAGRADDLCRVGAERARRRLVRPEGRVALQDVARAGLRALRDRRRATADTIHGAPLGYTSCKDPELVSGMLTFGTPDANGQQANGVGVFAMTTKVGNPSTPANEADVRST